MSVVSYLTLQVYNGGMWTLRDLPKITWLLKNEAGI